MSNDEVKDVKIGDNIRLYRGGELKPLDFEIAAVIERGVCKVSGTVGYLKSRWTLVESTDNMRIVLESDTYLEGMYADPFKGGFAISAAWRAGACPCPAGRTQPIITSSI